MPLLYHDIFILDTPDWGLYLAVEGVEESFLERNYGSNYGELYKPDSTSFGGGRGNGKEFNMGDFMNSEHSSENAGTIGQDISISPPDMDASDSLKIFDENMPQIPKRESRDDSESPRRKGEEGGRGASDVKLQYIDDNVESYSNIWNSAKTDITESDQSRLIESLRRLSNGEEIESVVDVEQVIRYFVVHNYVCNGDSYTGSMIHNYYLYEENGQMTMIPWDYNLAFGTFQGGDTQSTINTPIDSPVSGSSGEDRPMWNWILSDATYTELYHQYFSEFLNIVDMQALIDNAYTLIKFYVEKDPTAFYTYEEFETGVKTLRQFCDLRSESIALQLTNGETTSDMSYVDATSLILSDMGSMGGGGISGMRGNKGDFGGRESTESSTPVNPDMDTNGSSESNIQQTSGATPEELPQNGQMPTMPEGFDPSQIQDGFDSDMPEEFGGVFPGQSSDKTETKPSKDSGSTDAAENNNRPSRDNTQRPGSNFNPNMNDVNNFTSSKIGWIWLIISVLILGVGLMIAKLYKR